jgi:sec-independent protein translocase protein TatC
MEAFNVIWFKMPLMCAVFVASPWILYQVWGFIAPGLYKRERRWAAPFIIISAGLFILGGCFAYFVVFRYGLTFLLGIGTAASVTPFISVSEYFDLFVNVILGVGIVFELPVLIFFLTMLRILSPAFLIRHSRYAILAIVVLAAIITPTPDVFNLMLFAAPMVLLFYVGVFASYLLVLHRENRRFPWKVFFLSVLAVLLILAGIVYLAITRYGYRLVPNWPFLLR